MSDTTETDPRSDPTSLELALPKPDGDGQTDDEWLLAQIELRYGVSLGDAAVADVDGELFVELEGVPQDVVDALKPDDR
jgi:hypothetical protein